MDYRLHPSGSCHENPKDSENAKLQLEVLEDRAVPATFTVDVLGDDSAAEAAGTTLREALAAANANSDVDTIEFADGLSGTITLSQGQLEITNPVDIQGPGQDELTVSGNNASRVFDIDDGDSGNNAEVTISDLTITGGQTSGNGGGIYTANR